MAFSSPTPEVLIAASVILVSSLTWSDRKLELRSQFVGITRYS